MARLANQKKQQGIQLFTRLSLSYMSIHLPHMDTEVYYCYQSKNV